MIIQTPLRWLVIVFIVLVVSESCKLQEPKKMNRINIIHQNENELTELIVYDIFSPPVASRIYAYTALASYEAIRHARLGHPSLTAQLHGFSEMPVPEKNKAYDYLLAASKAFFTVAEKLTFSIDSLKKYEIPLFESFKNSLNKEVFDRSISFGESIGAAILKRTTVDNYKQTRGMAKFLGANEPGKWKPTPPDYLDGAEPNWKMILPLMIDSASQIKPEPPPVFSTVATTTFYKNMQEVYAVGKNLTDEQKQVAKYWDDNPFVIEHSGHLMFATKKITPVGHWIGITQIACKIKNVDEVTIAQTYAVTAIAIFDAFITCWNEKYRSQLVRPVTVINELIDKSWSSFLQTPPFPEHTSGHSTISAAAAAVLTNRFGNNFAFEDTSDFAYIGMKRNFSSFEQAASEASTSRLYGGIHYRSGCEAGAKNGKDIGSYIIKNLKLQQ